MLLNLIQDFGFSIRYPEGFMNIITNALNHICEFYNLIRDVCVPDLPKVKKRILYEYEITLNGAPWNTSHNRSHHHSILLAQYAFYHT